MWYLFFNLYKIYKVHKFLLDFLFADCFLCLIFSFCLKKCINCNVYFFFFANNYIYPFRTRRYFRQYNILQCCISYISCFVLYIQCYDILS